MPTSNSKTPKGSKVLKYNLFSKEDRFYWKNLDINVESYCDEWQVLSEDLGNDFAKFEVNQQAEVCKIYNLKRKYPTQSYLELLISAVNSAIDFYCVIQFVSKNKLGFSRMWDIPRVNGRTNVIATYIKALHVHKKTGLSTSYILNFSNKRGSARYTFDLQATENIDTLEKAKKILSSLIRYLNKVEKKRYHLRYIDKLNNQYYFLLLRSQNDEIIPAIPQNVRVIKGAYLLIQINISENKLYVHSNSLKEATRIRYYIAKKAKTKAKHAKETASYDPNKFFNSILNQTASSKLRLFDASFRKHNLGDSILQLQDRQKKNDIVATLKELKNKNVINLTDFSEFKAFEFYSQNLKFHVDVLEDKWGQLKLTMRDRGKQPIEVANFKRDFEQTFKIPFDKYLQNKNSTAEKTIIIRKLLEKPTIEATIPDEVDEIFVEFINKGILNKPINTTKRRCTNCYEIFWKQIECPNCGHSAYFEGEYIDISVNPATVVNILVKYLRSFKDLKVAKTIKQIENTKFTFIDVLNKTGDAISIYVSLGSPPDKVVLHFLETGNPLQVVILRFKYGIINDILRKGFECVDFADVYYTLANDGFKKTIDNAIQSQKDQWGEKLLNKGYESFKRLTTSPKAKYNDQYFEKDVYNLLHEVVALGDRLGGKFAGVKAPDGIVSLQNYSTPLLRYCIAWDCKYSKAAKGYSLRDSAIKHRHYINVLKNNSKVRFYGGLKSYIVISQNMNFDTYESFYNKLKSGFRWKGNVIFLDSEVLILIYKAYRDNASLIRLYPSIFYKKIFNLFKSVDKADSDPYPFISKRKLELILKQLQKEFKAKHKMFVFERKEFK